jgi:hypothetical protein
MPDGSPVLAAADGTVVEVIDRFDVGGPDRSFEERANLIVVDHGRGRFSVYGHLRRGGALVREGERVSRGQRIGFSGSTGWTTRPHLHFSVIDFRNRSLPVCFPSLPGGWPLAGQRYRGSAALSVPTPSATPLSLLPRDAFADNGVVLTADLPARWLGRSTPVRIAGRTTRPGARVAAWLMARGDGRASRYRYGAVAADGSFTVALDWTGLEGPQDFALAIAAPDGAFRSDFSVPVSLRARPAN